MDTLSYKTVSANKQTVNKEWVVIDAKNAVLGRLATKVAMILRGKHKASYTPHVDCGDHVIVINAENVVLTGNKMVEKQYIHHTGYPGGQRTQTATQLKAKSASLLVENAVRGMLPKNSLGRDLFRHLHVYNDAEHPHSAQQPTEIQL